jgi:hypothetical protein
MFEFLIYQKFGQQYIVYRVKEMLTNWLILNK